MLPEYRFQIFPYGQQSLNCESQEEEIYVAYQRDMLCFLFVVMNRVPWNQCIQFVHIMHFIEVDLGIVVSDLMLSLRLISMR